MQKKIAMAVAAGALLASVNTAFAAEEGNWMMRVRAVSVQWLQESSGGALPQNAIHLENKVVPEVDFTYFFSKNLAAELILTYPQKHSVSRNGTNIGSLKELPPTLLVQYHFMPDAQFRPYVGAGFNYTTFSDVNLPAGLSIDKSNFAGAFQLGCDIKVAANSYINLDLKKLYIKTDLAAVGTKISTIKGDPLLVGIGYGFKF